MCFWSSAAELARRRRPSPSATELHTHSPSQTVSRSSLYNIPEGTEVPVPSRQRAPSFTLKGSSTRHQPRARVSLTVPSATDGEPELEVKMIKPTIQTRTDRSSSGRTPRMKRDTTSLPPSPVPKVRRDGTVIPPPRSASGGSVYPRWEASDLRAGASRNSDLQRGGRSTGR